MSLRLPLCLSPGRLRNPGFCRCLLKFRYLIGSSLSFSSYINTWSVSFNTPFPCPLNTSPVQEKHRRAVWQMPLLAPAGGSILQLIVSFWFYVSPLFICNSSFLSIVDTLSLQSTILITANSLILTRANWSRSFRVRLGALSPLCKPRTSIISG